MEIRLGSKREPVRERGNCHVLDVVRSDELSTANRRERPRREHQRERASWRGANKDMRMLACRSSQSDHVFEHALVYDDGLNRSLHLDEEIAVTDGLEHLALLLARDTPSENLCLVRRVQVPERDPQQESIELGFGQWVGALVLDRICSREDVEWFF